MKFLYFVILFPFHVLMCPSVQERRCSLYTCQTPWGRYNFLTCQSLWRKHGLNGQSKAVRPQSTEPLWGRCWHSLKEGEIFYCHFQWRRCGHCAAWVLCTSGPESLCVSVPVKLSWPLTRPLYPVKTDLLLYCAELHQKIYYFALNPNCKCVFRSLNTWLCVKRCRLS